MSDDLRASLLTLACALAMLVWLVFCTCLAIDWPELAVRLLVW